jgi:hypothetical protein
VAAGLRTAAAEHEAEAADRDPFAADAGSDNAELDGSDSPTFFARGGAAGDHARSRAADAAADEVAAAAGYGSRSARSSFGAGMASGMSGGRSDDRDGGAAAGEEDWGSTGEPDAGDPYARAAAGGGYGGSGASSFGAGDKYMHDPYDTSGESGGGRR